MLVLVVAVVVVVFGCALLSQGNFPTGNLIGVPLGRDNCLTLKIPQTLKLAGCVAAGIISDGGGGSGRRLRRFGLDFVVPIGISP